VTGLIYDIGLHRGEDAEFYLKKGFQVVAVDADPDHCATACQKLSEFVSSGKLTIVNAAITDKVGEAVLLKSEKSDWGTVVPEWDAQNRARGFASRAVPVHSTTLAELIRAHGDPYFIKIDIEGMDSVALASLANAPALPKYLSVELAFPRDPTFAVARAEFELLRELGYDRFKIVAQHAVPNQLPVSPAREGGYVAHQFELGSSGLFGEESPGEWQTAQQALRAFRWIMLRHAPGAQLYRNQRLHDAYIALRRRLTGRPEEAYWYDVHAKRS
jgi:FkbM family methyltransferase